MEDAKAATDRAAESAEEANAKYESIASAIGEYESVVNTLESCTTGTEEWHTALEKVNEVTTDLINKYPELLDFYDTASGRFNLDEMKEYLELLE